VALHCGGNLDEMRDVAGAVPPLEGIAAERYARARSFLREPQPFDVAEALALVTEAAGTQVAALGADPTVQA
jgi:beta-N-acetylhexosaminidase